MRLKIDEELKYAESGVKLTNNQFNKLNSLLLGIVRDCADRKAAFEIAKGEFGNHQGSSSVGYAESDLWSTMNGNRDNAAIFLQSYWSALTTIERYCKVSIPSIERFNQLLQSSDIPFAIDGDTLVEIGGDASLSDGSISSSELTPDRYQRIAEIGTGGFAIVYHVRRTTSIGEFDFAMKVFDPSPFEANRERALERFKNEAHVLNLLQHRSIVPIIEAGVTQKGEAYLLMPLIQGNRLRDATQTWDWRRKLRAFREVLLGVSFAHEQKIIHRDLNPKNILVRQSDEQPIILDFGMAYLFGDDTPTLTTASPLGTPGYIAPEAVNDPKSRTPMQDVFSCGVILHELLAGQRPPTNRDSELASIDEQWAPFDKVVQRATANQAKRFSTVNELIQAVDQAQR